MAPAVSDGTDEAARTELREHVLGHLWRSYPHHCVVLTDPVTRGAIDIGIDRAAHHGFEDPVEVAPYVGLMGFLGSHFDQDVQLPWAAELLANSAELSRGETMARLLEETSRRMQPVVGAQGEYYRRALAWVSSRTYEKLAADYDDTDEGLTNLLRHVHRRKFDVLNEATVIQLVRTARTCAQHYGLASAPGTALYLGLMFLLGHAIDRDPFHPWVAAKLRSLSSEDPATRAQSLHAETLNMLQRFTRLSDLTRRDQP